MSMFFFGFLSLASSLYAQKAVVEITERSVYRVHVEAAREFTLYADASEKVVYKLEETPIFVWTNPRRSGGQAGHVFLWKEGTRPRAVCTIFSWAAKGVPTDRRIAYEWHTLAESTLVPKRSDADPVWRPLSGIKFVPVPKAVPPSDSPLRQKLEIKMLSSKFDVHSLDQENQRWPLRVLSAPLCGYETEFGQGAIVGWVGDAGNDPELMMLFEVRESQGQKGWHYSPIRMTDHQLFVELNAVSVWQSVRSPTNTIFSDSEHCYFRFIDKIATLNSDDLDVDKAATSDR